MSENGLDGGFASCRHYKNISTGEVRMFHKSVPVPEDYEIFSYTKNSKWYTNTKTGEVIRSHVELTGNWVNFNAHLKGASQYIDPEGVIHQVKSENAKPDWVLYSHSQGKRLYSDGKTVALFEHDKQPPGWEIYDEKFGKRMYTLPDGKRKWFKPGTEPQGAVEFVSSKGCRQYINLETKNIIQVPHGTQPDGYVEYSATSGAIWVIDKLGTQKRAIDITNIPDGFVLRPTRWKFGIAHINSEGKIKMLSEPSDGWYPYQEATKNRCEGWNFGEYYQNMIKNVKAQ